MPPSASPPPSGLQQSLTESDNTLLVVLVDIATVVQVDIVTIVNSHRWRCAAGKPLCSAFDPLETAKVRYKCCWEQVSYV